MFMLTNIRLEQKDMDKKTLAEWLRDIAMGADGGGEAAVGENRTLGVAGGAGSVEQSGDVIGFRTAGAPVYLGQTFGRSRFAQLEELAESQRGGVVGVESEIGVGHDAAQAILFGSHASGYGILLAASDKQNFGLGIPHDIIDLLGRRGCVDADRHGAVGESGEISDENIWVVGREYGDFTSLLYVENFERGGCLADHFLHFEPAVGAPFAMRCAVVDGCPVAVAFGLSVDKRCQYVCQKT